MNTPLLSPFLLANSLVIASQLETLKLVLVWLTYWVFALVYHFNSIERGSLFLFLTLLLLSVCVGFFYTNKTLSFYLMFEMSIPPILFLIILFGYQPEKLTAGAYLILYTVLSSLPMLLTILTLPTYLDEMAANPTLLVNLAMSLGFMVKTPLYLVHAWLPKAHVEAPVAGSMILAGVLLKLGSYGLMVFLPLFTHKLLMVYLYLSVIGGVLCSFTCVRQWDAKGLIAYSSVVHMGVVSVGVVSGSELGYYCAMVMVIAHGICSPLLFGLAFYLYSGSHTRLLAQNRGGLSTPLVCFFIFSLLAVNMGLPPFLNVWAEVLMFSTLMSMMMSSLPFLLASAFFGVLYNLVMYIMLAHGKESASISEFISPWHYISSLMLSLLLSFNTSMFVM